MATYKLGSGFDESSTTGPLIHSGAMKKVLEHVAGCQIEGRTDRSWWGGSRRKFHEAYHHQ